MVEPAMTSNETLYHYTSLEAACSIASNKELWVTELKHLNDSSEFEYGLKLAKSVGDRLDVPLPVSVPWGLWNTTLSSDVYIFSLSANGDQLSQWRAYCPNGGVSIGFKRESIEAIAKQYGYLLKQCEYKEKVQIESLEQLFKARFPDLITASSEAEHQELMFSRKGELENDHKFMQEFVRLIATFKESSFQEEAEYRLISPASGIVGVGGAPVPEWRVARGLPIQYTKLDMGQPLTDEELKTYVGQEADSIKHQLSLMGSREPDAQAFPPIRTVTVGPHSHQKVVQTSLHKLFLAKFRHNVTSHSPNGNIRVVSSSIPYRTG